MSDIQRAEVNGNTVTALDLLCRPVAATYLLAGGGDPSAPRGPRPAQAVGVRQ